MRRWPLMIAVAIPAAATAQQAPRVPAAPQATPTPAPQDAPAPATRTAQTAPPAATPQRSPAAEDANSDEPDIIVRGQRGLPGAVVGDIPPEEQLGPADIRSYGVNSVAELLNELSPQTRSGRGSGGAPVVLLNGRRIAGFQEIRDLPTEAIARVDILPEEVALKYGYRADQRVVNFVLRQRFRATTTELSDRITTRGDRNNPQGELDWLSIRRDQRFNVHSSYQQSAAVLEADRDVITAPGAIDQSQYRTLLGQARSFGTNATYARNVLGSIGATLNGTIDAKTGRSLQGLPIVNLTVPAGNPFTAPGLTQRAVGTEPLAQRTATITSHVGSTLNGQAGRWRWSLIGAYDRIDGRTLTDGNYDASGFQARLTANDPTANPNGPLNLARLPDSRAISRSQDWGLDAQANGSLFRLPAGEVTTSLAAGGDLIDFFGRSSRAGVSQRSDLTRDQATGRINLDLPITSRAQAFGGTIGTLSANVNAAVQTLSDFGTLTTLGYGANWAPVDAIRLIVSVTDEDGAPSPQQLGNPQVVTPNVRVFDYVNAANAVVTTISGGNANLRGFETHTAKIGLTVRPSRERDLTFLANYVSSHVDDPVASFSTATAAIAGAFPGRFTRDAAGQLTRVDTRPINFARTERSELRYGFNLSIPLKSQLQRQIEAFRAGTGPNPFAGLTFPGRRNGGQSGQPGAAPQGGAPATGQTGAPTSGATPSGGFGGPGGGGGFRGGGGGGGFGGRGGPGGGRLQFALYHTWHFTDSVLVASGGPRLDLINGDAIGSSGGQPRHEVEGQAGYTNNGLGARLSVNFRSATEVNGGTAAAPTRLDFGALTTASLRLFADPGQRLALLRKHPWLRGFRVTLAVDNVFDARERVRDQTGATPVNYQPDLLDPLGRTVRLAVRKLFF
ncbi:TonB-dependent receptor [Sphingomonas sp.]|uniref:TonB-dependent receptor n=1 Tax=Sphingomonas sp. TaxID=28214 RepID=UPI003CC5EFBD